MGSVWSGFGYDSKNDDYKVLRMIQKYINDKVYYNEAKVYSLNTNSWKSIQGIPYYIFCEDYHGVLVNEALHYTVITNESDLVCNFIASFDLNTEKFSLIECPNYNENSRSDLVPLLLEMGGCLCLVANHHTSALYHPPPNNCVLTNPLVESVDIWMMKEYGMKESWVMLFRICQLQSLGIYYVQIKPVFYSKDGRKILIEIDCKGLGWYDLKSKSVERLRAHGIPNGFMEMTYFVGSLVSLEEKQHQEKKALPKKNKKKNDLDDYLSAGFKLRL